MSEGFWMNLQDRYDRESTRPQVAHNLTAIDPLDFAVPSPG
jgi:plasmid maintenance system antidote protein VapI